MKNETRAIILDLQNVTEGEPWFGNSLASILRSVNPDDAYKNPVGSGHSLIALLYHTLSWSTFVLGRVQNDPGQDVHYFEQHDWIDIDPGEHSWEKGCKQLEQVHRQLIGVLQTKNDEWLKQVVPGRNYQAGYMLHGLVQHIIYHAGQIAYCRNLLRHDGTRS